MEYLTINIHFIHGDLKSIDLQVTKATLNAFNICLENEGIFKFTGRPGHSILVNTKNVSAVVY